MNSPCLRSSPASRPIPTTSIRWWRAPCAWESERPSCSRAGSYFASCSTRGWRSTRYLRVPSSRGRFSHHEEERPHVSCRAENGDRMVRTVQEDITGIRVIKALSKTEHESEKFGGIASDLASSEFRAQRVMSLTNPLTSLILNLGLVAVIVAGAILSAEAGDITGLSHLLIHRAQTPCWVFRASSSSFRAGRRLPSASKRCLRSTSARSWKSIPRAIPPSRWSSKTSLFLRRGQGAPDGASPSPSIRAHPSASSGRRVAASRRRQSAAAPLRRFRGAVYVDGQDVRSLPSEKLRKKFGRRLQNGLSDGGEHPREHRLRQKFARRGDKTGGALRAGGGIYQRAPRRIRA